MGNPKGLISDESDFLLYPAQIVFGVRGPESCCGNASLSLDGHTRGINGFLWATQKLCGLTFEPFIRGGNQFFDTDGSTQVYGPYTVGLNKKKTGWFTGGGFPVLFGK
ncbi:MAG: hypothetical protein OS130_06715 [Thermodesulfobacteriota bacterium]|jgi:hypothetical protein|nr:MAG: hypothetical protein OS130_06715 [Thermodesulfobacteriota bacterium]